MQKDGFFNNGIGIPHSWNSIFEIEKQVSEQIPNCYINSNWDHSLDQSDPFESALSSIVSSPVNSQSGITIPGCENVVLKELIGRLGTICNSGNTSANTSCYNTPLNSPPKLNLDHHHHHTSIPRNNQLPLPLAPFPADPGFVERAARLSCFVETGKFSSNQSFKNAEFSSAISASDNKANRVSMSIDNKELDTSMEGSSLSEQNINVEIGIKSQNISSNGRKRKVISKEKGKETHSSTLSVKENKTVGEHDAKRSKSDEQGNGIEKEKKEGNQKQTKENAKQAEPPKDYIHVRARRGEATDSHSLAERVRREKISERMKFLQSLVPGCNKVTGKAVMLDEIINYVQSLQRQVEFLSMKLATVNYRTDMNAETVLSKDTHAMNHLDALAQPFYAMAHDGPENPLTAMMQLHGSNMKSSQINGFGEASAFWENDLQSVVQTGFSQNQEPNFHGKTSTRQMKVEL
ncbi:hypothetical protein QVD17_15029 [Tagetes erecta]|uniref:BHLH domain-containing protein n=1 Tax=Tagetes erecta TaxID=13708 RepID=A0AAD8KP24_TARER|nr:hypothetical protein QVD17_15029 [Tagetes erecta]